MRRRSGFLVKLFNLVYIAAAGISVYALCTRPILKANVHVSFTKEKMGSLLSGLLNRGSSEEESEEERLVYRVDDRREVKDYLTKEKLESCFPDGYKVDLPITISAEQAWDIKNTHLLDDLIQINLGTIVDNVYKSIGKPLSNLFKNIVEDFAKDSLTDEINKAIAERFGDDALPASEEEIQAIFDDVYSLLDDGEPVTVDQLAETILHGTEGGSNGILDIINSRGSKYVPWEPQPSEEEVNADITAEGEAQQYFVRVVEYKHNTAAYNESTDYYTKTGADEYTICVPKPEASDVEADREAAEGAGIYFVESVSYKHNEAPYDSGTTYYKATPYTSEDIDDQAIAQQMTESLENIDGLVTSTLKECSPQPTQQQVEDDIAKEEAKRTYYIYNESHELVRPTAYSSADTYYYYEKTVNDIDSAMAALIDSYMNGGAGGGRAHVRAEEPESVESSEEKPKSIEDQIKDYLYGFIPSNVSESAGTVGEKAPLILLALIAIFALPWLWFGIVTILRTIRRSKFWTRPMIVLFWAFPQLIFGIGLTYGSKYILPFLATKFEQVEEYVNSFSFDIRTGCLIPSFVYLGVLAMTIVYWIIRRPIKIQYKMERYAKKRRPRRPREPKHPRQPKPQGPRHPQYPFDNWEYNEKDKIWW